MVFGKSNIVQYYESKVPLKCCHSKALGYMHVWSIPSFIFCSICSNMVLVEHGSCCVVYAGLWDEEDHSEGSRAGYH